MNSVLSRAPGRRGGRRPGWTLMTALLILAIAASSALVFTSRVELLKLAVIIALWAAVAAAFVSVIYRRQSDVDQARARDLKLVYDLQLDREISARREYELTVESQLRRELASELRAQAADEVAALRSELAALRTNLEILFDADLSHRPALEPERAPVRAYSDWARSGGESATGATRVASSATPIYPPDSVTQTAENPIIDVPEVRIPAAGNPTSQAPQTPRAPHGEGRRGSHRRSADESPWRAPDETPPPQPAAARWSQPPQPFIAPEPRREPEPPPPPAPAPSRPTTPTPSWKPVGAEGEWLPPGAPGSNWSADVPADTGRHGAPERSAEAPSRHGRHADSTESVAAAVNGVEPARQEGEGRRRARSRHAAESAGNHARPAQAEPAPPVAEPQAGEPAAAAHAPSARHSAGADGSEQGPSTGGQSVADLLARLQPTTGEGRRRRRRED
ncbi:hypothetical protein K3U94_21230 [Mycolicibacter heraklionensis]|uniref:DUF6779 domain-containing protein n=1 Tax=Mycolicibacter heraklionensis TaxID=512402 RepID=A0A9X7ZG16_9MYCO|nr:DUF6779 domain-containing protein [Mycolicibacter heraklionensis]QZA07430.1 hypothetical protein K3U94_21230 [Mycolicibacter heraklionensis]